MAEQTQPQAGVEPVFMEDIVPESGEAVSLAQFLRWLHTPSNPYDPNFLMDMANVLQLMHNSLTGPDALAEGHGVVGKIDTAIALLMEERHRLEALFKQYQQYRAEVQTRHSVLEAAEWMKQNMPNEFERIERRSVGQEPANVSGKTAA